MNATKLKTRASSVPIPVGDTRYCVRLAANAGELASAFRLRHEVFNLEIAQKVQGTESLEFDEYDFKCRHLIVIDSDSNATVGTYRLNTIETAGSTDGFYSGNEFTIEDLPVEILENGIEIGRACIAKEHRNTKVLFLLWKGMLDHLENSGKRYFFGCCSLFKRDEEAGRIAYYQLHKDGNIHERIGVRPKHSALALGETAKEERAELPPLFNMYLRLGAKVCGPPIVDREFGSIDFFVVFDVRSMSDKYRRMFTR